MPQAAHSPGRFISVDALRGCAIVLMVIYHFAFDLSYFRLADFDFYRDPFWLTARTLILSSFLALVGISLALATARGLDRRRYLRRLGVLAASALLVSASTWWMFGDRFVYFGVLHFIAVASVLALPFVRAPWTGALLGIAILVIGTQYQSPWFDAAAWRWIGLMTHKPATEDYVPLLPWFGVVLLGVAAGRLLLKLRPAGMGQAALQRMPAARALAFAGRHSLLIYLVHQPVLLGLLYVYVAATT